MWDQTVPGELRRKLMDQEPIKESEEITNVTDQGTANMNWILVRGSPGCASQIWINIDSHWT